MAAARIPARRLRKGHVLAATGERVVWRTTGGEGWGGFDLLGADGKRRAMTYADEHMVEVEVEVVTE